MSERTREEMIEMERQVMAWRATEAAEARRAVYEATQPMRTLIEDGTVDRVIEAATAVFGVVGADPDSSNLRASSNAIRIGLGNLAPVITAMPAPPPPASDAPAS